MHLVPDTSVWYPWSQIQRYEPIVLTQRPFSQAFGIDRHSSMSENMHNNNDKTKEPKYHIQNVFVLRLGPDLFTVVLRGKGMVTSLGNNHHNVNITPKRFTPLLPLGTCDITLSTDDALIQRRGATYPVHQVYTLSLGTQPVKLHSADTRALLTVPTPSYTQDTAAIRLGGATQSTFPRALVRSREAGVTYPFPSICARV